MIRVGSVTNFTISVIHRNPSKNILIIIYGPFSHLIPPKGNAPRFQQTLPPRPAPPPPHNTGDHKPQTRITQGPALKHPTHRNILKPSALLDPFFPKHKLLKLESAVGLPPSARAPASPGRAWRDPAPSPQRSSLGSAIGLQGLRFGLSSKKQSRIGSLGNREGSCQGSLRY